MSCGVAYRCGLDPALLWLWHRPAPTALIRPLAWEPPYATGAALEMAKRQKKKTQCSIGGIAVSIAAFQKHDPYMCCLQETNFIARGTYRLKVRGWKMVSHAVEIKRRLE